MLLDAVVDHFFPVLESLGERIEQLEDEILDHPTRESGRKLHEFKRMLTQLKRYAWPQREVVNLLARDQTSVILPHTKVFLRDCYDHAVQIMDIIESYRDLTSGMMEIYLSSVGMRTNEVMKVLTIISTIFIPLTFIVGVYGMNFDHMPELHTRWGYGVVWFVMLGIAGGLLLFFKRKDWI
jgi:magnesium transporter